MDTYFDGEKDANEEAKTDNIESPSSAELWIGHGDNLVGDANSDAWNGSIDEIRISDTARSADWVAAQYLSMTDDFIHYGVEEGVSDVGAAYIFFGYPGIDLSNINAANANVTIYGENAGDLFGWSVSDLGNVDSDSKDDIIIGAPNYNPGYSTIWG